MAKKLITIVSFAVIFIILSAFGLCSLFDKDEAISEAENRTLAQKPSFSLTSYFSGEYTKLFEEYYNDQFPARNALVKLSNKIEAFYSSLRVGDGATIIQSQGGVGEGEALSRPVETDTKENSSNTVDTTDSPTNSSDSQSTKPENAVSVDDDVKETVYSAQYVILLNNRAMEMYSNNYKKIDGYIDTLNRLKKGLPDTKVYCLLAPTSIEFYAPKKYNNSNSKSQYQGIEYAYSKLKDITPIDAYSAIAPHTDEYLYFRTDHHWTARGAYYAYTAFSKVAKFDPVDIKSLETGVLKPFTGSLFRATQSTVLEKNPDYLEYFVPKTTTTAIAANDAAMKESYKIKVINTNITTSNKYLAFVEGDHPVVKITTDTPGNRSILIIKESYGNAFVPWLCNNYKEIYVIDPRKLTVDISSFVKSNFIQEVMFLNYMFIPTNNTFMDALNKMG